MATPEKKKTCFVIMPISTHESHLVHYREDKDHFKHVLDHLFVPAIESIDYELIPPSAKGSDLIHAEIIRNLEESDLVLCDMSTLNPNVFFELGIRTALNKPVCIVRDDKTANIPFDMGIINSHKYSSDLSLWIIENEIKALVKHLEESIKRSGSENMLWRQFGITNVAKEYEHKAGDDPKMEYLMMQIDSIRNELEDQKNIVSVNLENRRQEYKEESIISAFKELLKRNNIEFSMYSFKGPNHFFLETREKLTEDEKNLLFRYANELNLDLRITNRPT